MEHFGQPDALVFDSSRIPEADRISAYNAYMQRSPRKNFNAPLLAESASDNPNYNRVERLLADNFWLSKLDTSGHSVLTRPNETAGEDASFAVSLVRSSAVELRTTKETLRIGPGDFFLRATARAEIQSTLGAGQLIRMVFPQSQFGKLQNFTGHPMVLRASDPIASILSSVISGLELELRTTNKANKQLLSRMTRDLVYNIVTDAKRSVDQGRHEFLLQRGTAYIKNHLHEPDLDANAIANHLGVSRATLYRVFEPQGGVRSCITRFRLDAARRMLLSVPMQRGLIANVAYSCGFASPELFSRAFKAGFGVSPSEFSERNFGI